MLITAKLMRIRYKLYFRSSEINVTEKNVYYKIVFNNTLYVTIAIQLCQNSNRRI